VANGTVDTSFEGADEAAAARLRTVK